MIAMHSKICGEALKKIQATARAIGETMNRRELIRSTLLAAGAVTALFPSLTVWELLLAWLQGLNPPMMTTPPK
jgi:hypothetical protein